MCAKMVLAVKALFNAGGKAHSPEGRVGRVLVELHEGVSMGGGFEDNLSVEEDGLESGSLPLLIS